MTQQLDPQYLAAAAVVYIQSLLEDGLEVPEPKEDAT